MDVIYEEKTWFWVNGNAPLLTLKPEYFVLIKKEGRSQIVLIRELKAC
jgi:hypothetical protein